MLGEGLSNLNVPRKDLFITSKSPDWAWTMVLHFFLKHEESMQRNIKNVLVPVSSNLEAPVHFSSWSGKKQFSPFHEVPVVSMRPSNADARMWADGSLRR